jgi:pimeloyl-ACP methyl ester carboxylesterase
MAKLGVLFVHGMGNQGPSYADEMAEELKARIDRGGADPTDVEFKAAYWGDLLNSREDHLLRRMRAEGELDWVRLRRDLVVSGFGDAVAYLGPATSESPYYGAIHARLETALNELQEELETHEHAPVVIIAHSLGCAIASNYLWDAQNDTTWARGDSPLTRGDTVAGFITMGCNLPLLSLALRPSEVHAVKVPAGHAESAFKNKAAFREHAGWFNFYDPDDLLGYPLKPTSASYEKAVRADIAISAGPVWSAHTSYWTDNDVTVPVAKRLVGLLNAI